VFKENARFIHEFSKKGKSYKLALNKFGDLTEKEFKGSYAVSRVQEHRMFHPRVKMDKFLYDSINNQKVHIASLHMQWKTYTWVQGISGPVSDQVLEKPEYSTFYFSSKQ
jgi:Cathepsin propeptide inhibitor domain (I29)